MIEKLLPDLLRKAAVECAVAVQVAELSPAKGEGEFAAAAGSRLHARPGSDLFGDPLACRLGPGHDQLLFIVADHATSSSALEVKPIVGPRTASLCRQSCWCSWCAL